MCRFPNFADGENVIFLGVRKRKTCHFLYEILWFLSFTSHLYTIVRTIPGNEECATLCHYFNALVCKNKLKKFFYRVWQDSVVFHGNYEQQKNLVPITCMHMLYQRTRFARIDVQMMSVYFVIILTQMYVLSNGQPCGYKLSYKNQMSDGKLNHC